MEAAEVRITAFPKLLPVVCLGSMPVRNTNERNEGHASDACLVGPLIPHLKSLKIFPEYLRPFLVTVAAMWHMKYNHTRSNEDLDQAIEINRLSLELADHHDQGKTDRADCHVNQNNLGVAFYARFENTRSSADLDNAKEALLKAVGSMPEDDPCASAIYTNLGCVLDQYFSSKRSTQLIGNGTSEDSLIPVHIRYTKIAPSPLPSGYVLLSEVCSYYLIRIVIILEDRADSRPRDPVTLHQLAESYTVLGDIDVEIAGWWRLFERHPTQLAFFRNLHRACVCKGSLHSGSASFLFFCRICGLYLLSRRAEHFIGCIDWWPFANKDDLMILQPFMEKKVWSINVFLF